MLDPWQLLRDGGLPLATERSGVRPTSSQLAAAIHAAIAEAPTGRDAEALGALIVAWHAHWPSSFADELGPDAPSVIAWADAALHDPDRRLKLRRIAIENLSGLGQL